MYFRKLRRSIFSTELPSGRSFVRGQQAGKAYWRTALG
jgi:hypothetical protein